MDKPATSTPESGAPQPLPQGTFALMVHPWTWLMALRDSRKEWKRLLIFAASIVVGISALVTIHALRSSLEQGIDLQARALLGADLLITSREAFTDADREAIDALAEESSFEISFSSMLNFVDSGGARLVQVRGIEGAYPFYGEVLTEPDAAWRNHQARDGLLLEPALLEQFNASAGDQVKLGNASIEIIGTVQQPAPRSGRFAGFAPEVYLRASLLEATGLLTDRSIASFHAHLRLSEEMASAEVIEALRTRDGADLWRFETPESRRDQLGRVLDQFEQFLGLIALFSLILGAIGVASAMHAQIRRRRASIAILRCLGAPARASFAIYLIQAGLLGLVAAVAGGGLGVGIHFGVVYYFAETLPVLVEPMPNLWVVGQTTLAGFLACCGFAVLPLLQIRDIAPLQVLRQGGSTAQARRRALLRSLPVVAFLFVVMTLLSILNSTNLARSLVLTVGFAGVFGVLALVAWTFIALTRKLTTERLPYLLRQGISNCFRPQNQTMLFVLSLGLGVFLMLSTMLIRDLVLAQVQVSESEIGPNIYLVDVQSDQVDGVKALLEGNDLPVLESAPMVSMRVAEIKGVSIRELREQGLVGNRMVRREFRSSYRDHLNETETHLGGTWPPSDWDGNEPIPLSLEVEIAGDLGVELGDRMVIDVQGVPIEVEVQHLRAVDWSRFNLNFFMLFPPGVLEGAPGFTVVTTRIPPDETSGQLQRALVEAFPNVSAIDLTLLLETIRTILARVTQAIQLLSGFTLGAGCCILIGIFLNGRDQRIRESVLLRTLGASTRQLRSILCVEFGVLGLLAALTGGGLALVTYSALAHFAFELSPVFHIGQILLVLLASTVLSIFMGALFSRGVCAHSPLATLRQD